MSAQHHSPHENEATRRMLEEFLQVEKPKFPQGRLNDKDDGEIAFAVAADESNRVVVIRFAKPVDWIGLDAKSARHLAALLTEKAGKVEA